MARLVEFSEETIRRIEKAATNKSFESFIYEAVDSELEYIEGLEELFKNEIGTPEG